MDCTEYNNYSAYKLGKFITVEKVGKLHMRNPSPQRETKQTISAIPEGMGHGTLCSIELGTLGSEIAERSIHRFQAHRLS